MNPNMSNTQRGIRPLVTNVDFTGKKSYLAKIIQNPSVAGEVLAVLPTADGDLCPFVCEDEAASGKTGAFRPLYGDQNVRLVASGTIAGGTLVMAANGGKIKAHTDGNWHIGITEEDAVDGQLVLVRPNVGNK